MKTTSSSICSIMITKCLMKTSQSVCHINQLVTVTVTELHEQLNMVLLLVFIFYSISTILTANTQYSPDRLTESTPGTDFTINS